MVLPDGKWSWWRFCCFCACETLCYITSTEDALFWFGSLHLLVPVTIGLGDIAYSPPNMRTTNKRQADKNITTLICSH